MMKHGIQVDTTPSNYGSKGGITDDGELFPYSFDKAKAFWNISRPTRDNMDTLRWIELNPPVLLGEERFWQQKKVEIPHNVPWEELRGRVAMLPKDVVKQTFLDATTQLYMEVENKHRNEPQEHYHSCCPGLRNFRQNDTVVSDTYFPTKVTNQGHTCLQMFVGLDSDFWVTYPLKTESANGEALHDYTHTHSFSNTELESYSPIANTYVGIPTALLVAATNNGQSHPTFSASSTSAPNASSSQGTQPNHRLQGVAQEGRNQSA
jgi:hypothetical protein